MNNLTDIYSRRYPYFWGHKGTRDIIVNFLLTADKKFAKTIKVGDTKQSLYYYDLSCAFDIEDSSFYEGDEKRSVMYVWQFGVENVVIMGRTWDEFIELCDTIKNYTDKCVRLIVYVHFLDHEFQFMRKRFTWDSVFSREVRSPIYAVTGGIEFRDSYILSGKSLANTAKDIRSNRGLKKRVGDLDYSLVRGYKTHLTRREIGYCMADVQILNTYIREKIEDEGENIAHIPLTNTGYVRRYVRSQCLPHKKELRYKSNIFYRGIHSLNLTANEYNLLKWCFAGGFTHSNALYSGDTLRGKIDSIDFTSSYPAVILSNPFPGSSGKRVHPKSQKEFDEYIKDYLSIFVIKFKSLNTRPDVYDNIISVSKCRGIKGGVFNNGRIVSAEEFTTAMTNIDLECVRRFYTYDHFTIGDMYIYEKRYMPRSIIESVLELYRAKTTLKGVPDSEVEYMLKKGMLNSIFGMMVTDIVKSEILCDESGEWIGEKVPDLAEAICQYNDNKRRFLFYPWGVCDKLCQKKSF